MKTTSTPATRLALTLLLFTSSSYATDIAPNQSDSKAAPYR